MLQRTPCNVQERIQFSNSEEQDINQKGDQERVQLYTTPDLQNPRYMLPTPPKSSRQLPLHPIAKSKWQYMDPHKLANRGIYSADNVEKLKEHIMFPVEKAAFIDGLVQGAPGRDHATETLQIHSLLDEDTLEKIANYTVQKIWNGFLKFGSVSAGIMGIYITWRIIKTIINTNLNGIALHKVYGWSACRLVAAWTSLTQFCTFLEARNHPTSRECMSNVQMSSLKLQVNTSDAPNKDNQSEQM